MASFEPKVVFIGGAGRSGTTLLGNLLGQHKDFFSAGEMAQIWVRGSISNQLCGCGEPFLRCPFWTVVMSEGLNSSNPKEVERLRRSVQRIRYMPYYYLEKTPPKPEILTYEKLLAALYSAVSKISGASTIIDSSKEPPHGFILASTPGISTRVVHMVRDSRAVAFSLKRRKVRPEIHWKTQYMPQAGVVVSSLRWNYYNICTEALVRRVKSWRRVRYEDLASSPSRLIDELLVWLGSNGESTSGFDSSGSISMAAGHSIGGNPSRFDTGRIQVRADEEWKVSMSRRDRAAVVALTFPLLLKYYGSKGISRRG